MGGVGVIDGFLQVFTSYIDSGFGLLGGDVAFLATTLIVIDVTLAALFWACYGPVAGRQPGRPTLTHLATALTSLAISGAASFSNWTF